MDRPPLSSFAGTTTRPALGSFAKPVVQPVVPQPVQTATNWASNIPGLKQVQNFGVGVGSAIGNAGLGLGQTALRIGAGVGDLMNKVAPGSVDTSLARGAIDTLEKGKQAIFNKPFEGNKNTISGTAGTFVGTLAPYFAGGAPAQASKLALGTLVPRAVAALPFAATDATIAAGQSGGDWKSALATGGASLVGNTILPGAGSPIAQKIITGGVTGYVGDVGAGLAGQRGEDRTGVNATIPGWGTAIGTGMGVISAVPQIRQAIRESGAQKTFDKRQNALTGLQKSYSVLDKKITAADKSGLDTKKFIANSDLLEGAVDTNGVIDTKSTALPKLENALDGYESVVGDALRAENKQVSLTTLKLKLEQTIDEAGLIGNVRTQAIQKMNADLEDLARIADPQGNVSLARVHDLKVQTNQLNAKSFVNPESNRVGKVLGSGLRQFVEGSSDVMDIHGYNAELRKFYAVQDVLEALNGRRVEGGRLGKYFAQTVGAVVGNALGGPIGAVAGAEAGGVIKGATMSRAFGGKGGEQVRATPAMVAGREAAANATPHSNIFGSRNTTQSTTMSPTKNVIPETVPQPKPASTPLSPTTPEPVQKTSLPKSTTRPVNVAKEELRKLTEYVKMLEDDLSNSPAKALVNKMGRGDNTLAQLQENAMRRGNNATRLDNVDELGFKDLDEAQAGVEQYYKDKERLAQYKQGIKTLRKEISEGTDVETYDTGAYTNALTPDEEADMLLRLTRERGAAGTPSDEWLLGQAKRELAKTPNDPKLKAFVAEKELMVEARKHKSPEEFVKASKPIYHGTPAKFDKFDTSVSEGNATWFTADKRDIIDNTAGAVQPAGAKLNIMERYPKPNLKLATPKQADEMYTDQLIARGYAGVKYPKGEYGDYEWTKLFNPNEDTITRSQLTDIHNRAHAQQQLKAFVAEKELMVEARKYKTAEEFVQSSSIKVENARTKLRVAEDGKPITVTVFHGSPDARFAEEFNPNKKGYYKDAPDLVPDNTEWNKTHGATGAGFKTGKGVYEGISFTDDRSVAQSYASKMAFDNENSVPMVLERTVNLQKPKVINVAGGEWELPLEDTIAQAKKQGYDGIIFKNIKDNYHPSTTKAPSNNLIVFSENQIKNRSQLTDIYNRAHAQQPSTFDRIKKAILPGDTPNKEGGMVRNPLYKQPTPTQVAESLTAQQIKDIRAVADAGIPKAGIGDTKRTLLVKMFKRMDIEYPRDPKEFQDFLIDIVDVAEKKGIYKRIPVLPSK